MTQLEQHSARLISVDTLQNHPDNYRDHPDDQLEEIMQSMREHGVYRNVVAANDFTILAGHGVVEAARRLKLDKLKVVKLDIAPDSQEAKKILIADNFLSHFAIDDDRLVTDMLKDLAATDDLAGTGFDEAKLAAYAMVTRPMSEIESEDHAKEWAGMPSFEQGEGRCALTLHFEDEETRDEYIRDQEIIVTAKSGWSWSAHWPPSERDDIASVKVEG